MRLAAAGRLFDPTQPSSRRAVLAAAAVGFAAVFALRIAVEDPDRPVSLLYAIPIAFVAVASGAFGGLAAAVLGVGLYAVAGIGGQVVADDPAQYVLRSAAFLVIGVGVGVLADGLRATVRTVHAQNELASALARAETLEEGLADALAAIGRDGGWDVAVFWQRAGEQARRRAAWVSPEVTVELAESREWRQRDVDALWDAADAAPAPLGRGMGAAASVDSVRVGALEVYGSGTGAPTTVAFEALRVAATQIALFVKRKEAEEELRVARDDADRANRAKSEFLSRMSHELRTPLNAILGFGQLLQMDELDDEQREGVDHIVKAGEHLLGLINEVLDIARIEAGRISLSIERVHLGTAVAEAVDVVRPLANEREVTIVVHDDTLDMWTMTDNQRLKQILLNLLSNAVKYNRHGGSIVVDAAPNEHWMRVRVQDTGLGISEAAVPRLFDAFSRGDSEGSGIQGTGLGLALSKRLIEALAGAIGVESTLGEGTCFWIDVPAAAAPDEIEEALAASADGDLAMRRIVYIEDNLANLKLVEQICSTRGGLQVVAAMQGSLGIDLARRHSPDAILLDLHLPDMNGEEVLTLLRGHAETRDVPVIVLTAEHRDSVANRVKDLGAFAVLTKPLDINEFVSTLDAALTLSEPTTRDAGVEALAG